MCAWCVYVCMLNVLVKEQRVKQRDEGGKGRRLSSEERQDVGSLSAFSTTGVKVKTESKTKNKRIKKGKYNQKTQH